MNLAELRESLEGVAEPERAEPMAAYMKNKFAFLGVRSAEVKRAMKPLTAASKAFSGDELIAVARQCWQQDEREFQYAAVKLLRQRVRQLEVGHIEDLEYLITSKSWWDTVDGLAAWTVGPLVGFYPELVVVMDDWIGDENVWLARTAIIHQLTFKAATDADRLFAYADAQAEHQDFFIRKAIGWALRQYARENPDAVRDFVHARADRLSGLTKREALKHLTSE